MIFRAPQYGKRRDPLDGFSVPVDRSGAVLPKVEKPEAPEWRPPESARTFADYDAAAAGRLCAGRPHVLLREDPMFGRRGYAKGVIADPKHGFLVLVIAFTTKRDSFGNWVEPIKPKDEDRRYWQPGKVEIV